MGESDHLAFLFEELDRWRCRGLIDGATHQRLRWFYAARHPMAADAVDARCSASNPARAPAPSVYGVDELDRQLHEHAQLHFQFEELARQQGAERAAERAAAAAEPVASRSSALGSALLEAAADVLAVDRAEPDPPSVEQQVIESESRWSATLRPLLNETALWLAGGLLTVAGSLYFLGLAWDRLDSVMLHLVIAAALHLYAAGFFGVGLALVRRRQAHTVGRILFGFTVVLLPLANLAVGELGAVLMQGHGTGGLLLGVGVLVATLVGQGLMLAVIGGLYERRSIGPLVETGLVLAALTSAIAPLSVLVVPSFVYVALLAVALVALARGTLRASQRLHLRMSLLLLAGGASWALAVLVGRLQLVAEFAPTHYATLLAAVAALFAVLDHRLRLRAGHPPRLTAIGLSLHAAILLSLVAAIGGLATLGYFDLTARLTVLACAATAAVMFARAAWLHGRSAMSYLAALAGLFAYFFLPAPFLGILQVVHRWASGALGYAHEPLPMAYYGLTFIPYVLSLGILAWRLRTKRPDLRTDMLRFLMVLGALLVVLALTSVADLRPMLWTWPAYAVGCWVAARAFRTELLHYAGHALTIAFVCTFGVWALRAGIPLPPFLLLCVCAVPVAAASIFRGSPKHVAIAAGAALVVAPLAGVFGGLTFARLAMALAAGALAQTALVVRTRSEALAVLAGLTALGAIVTTGVALEASVRELYLVLLSCGLGGGAAVAALRRAPEGSLRSTGLRRSAIVASTVALLGAFVLGIWTGPSWAPLLVAAGMVPLAILSRGAALTPVAGLMLAAGVGLTAQQVVAGGWPLALAALACATLMLAASVPPSWPAARDRARSLVAVSLTALGVGLCALWWRALPGHPAAAWWGFAANSSVLAYALTGALLQRGRRPDLAAGLLAAVALFGALAASFVLEALVDVPPGARIWLHGSLLAIASLAWTGIARRLGHPGLTRAAGWVACALSLPSLGVVTLAAFVSAVLGLWFAAPEVGGMSSWLDLSWPAVLCGGLTLLAVRAATELRERRLGWHLGVLALVGTATIAASVLWGPAYLAIPTAVAGLALGIAAALRAPLFGRSVPLAWPLGVLAVGLLSTHFELGFVALPLVMACLTIVLFVPWVLGHAEHRPVLASGWSLALGITVQVATLWGAIQLSTGRYPPTVVLSLLGPAAVGAALLLRLAAQSFGRDPGDRPVARHAHGNLLLAAVLVCLGIVANAGAAPWLVAGPALVTLAAVAGVLIHWGRVDRRAWMLHAAAVVVPLLYLVLRTQTGLATAGPLLDGFVLLTAAQLAFWWGSRLERRDPLAAKALQIACSWWPLLSVAIAPALSASGFALLGLLVAVHYAVVAQVAQDKHMSVPAMFFGNLALFSSWAALGWSDLLAYAIPVGLTLLALIHVYAIELGRRPRKILRRVVVAGLYVLSVGDALLAATPVQALVLVPILCVTGIAIGAITRVRVYLVMGVAFLAADLVLTMVRYGLESRPLGALFLTLLGLMLVTAMVLFSLDRERILRRYALVLGELRAWE